MASERQMTVFTFTVPGQPVPKGRPRSGPTGFYTPAKTRTAERTVGLYALAEMRAPLTEPLRVELRFHAKDKRRVDVDNLAKLVLDAMNGVAWRDDSQIVFLAVEKHVDAEDPRTEIRVETL